MTLREAALALAVLIGSAAIVYGVWLIHAPSAFIVGGVLGTAWAVLVLADDGAPK